MKQIFGRIIIGGAVALALAACGASTASTPATTQPDAALEAPTTAAPSAPTAAAQGGPAAAAPTAASGAAPNAQAGAARGGPRGVAGTVESINGSTLTLKDQRQQSTITVALNDSTQFFKQSSIALASAPVGQMISAFGQQNGDIFTATQIRVGQANGPDGRGGNGQPGQATGTAQPGGATGSGRPQPNGTGPGGRAQGQRLFGTIEQVSSDALTVKTMAGATVQVQLDAKGQIFQQVAATSADLKAGEQIIVMGQRDNTTVTASRVEIMPAMTP